MRRLIRNLIPLSFLAIAYGIHAFIPASWGDRDSLALIIALLGTMIILADLIEASLGKVFNPYSHLWCFIIAPGTILHELGHLTACFLTRTTVTEFRLFSPNPNTGQLGYVNFAFKQSEAKWSVIKGLIIAMAPFFGGAAALTGLLYLVSPDVITNMPKIEISSISALSGELEELYNNLKVGIIDNNSGPSWVKYLAIYGILVIGSGAAPSTTDFAVPFKQGARRWLGAILALVFLASLSFCALQFPSLSQNLISVLALAAACQMVSLSAVISIRLSVGTFGFLFLRGKGNKGGGR